MFGAWVEAGYSGYDADEFFRDADCARVFLDLRVLVLSEVRPAYSHAAHRPPRKPPRPHSKRLHPNARPAYGSNAKTAAHDWIHDAIPPYFATRSNQLCKLKCELNFYINMIATWFDQSYVWLTTSDHARAPIRVWLSKNWDRPS